MILVTAISVLTTTALGYVVFGSLGDKAGLWDDLAFVVSALVFVLAFARLLGERAFDTMDEARRPQSDTESSPSNHPGRRSGA